MFANRLGASAVLKHHSGSGKKNPALRCVQLELWRSRYHPVKGNCFSARMCEADGLLFRRQFAGEVDMLISFLYYNITYRYRQQTI